MNKEKQRQEAIKRIKILEDKYGIGKVMLKYYESEEVYGRDNTDKDRTEEEYDYISKLIKEFKEEYNAEVYYFMISYLNHAGYQDECLDLFFVGQHEEEWEEFREPKDNQVYVYSINLSMNNYKEFGYIGISVDDEGNLIRTF